MLYTAAIENKWNTPNKTFDTKEGLLNVNIKRFAHQKGEFVSETKNSEG